ncbi:MAG: hypothetical protein ACC628_26970 [Pirellulaceae bacterium]
METRDGTSGIPDGLIHVQRGKSEWVALVEVKTSSNHLDSDQINRYLQIANGLGYDAMLTISNEIVADPSDSPVTVHKRRTRSVKLIHLSWSRIMTEAVIESEHRGVDDPEQAWILDELIAYLDDEKSGASGYEGMGKEWVRVRDAAKQRTLDTSTPGVTDVAGDWEQFMEYLALRLRQRLGRKVGPSYPRSSTGDSRLKDNVESLTRESILEATITLPGAAAPIYLQADLASGQVTTSARVGAPSGKERSKTRLNWMMRQLKDTPNDLRIEVHFKGTRTTITNMVEKVRDKPDLLLLPADPRREPTAFTLAVTRDMGNKRGRGQGSFVGVAMDQTIGFYREVLQKVDKYVAPAPKLKAEPEPEDDEKPKRVAPTPDLATDTDGDGLSDHDERHVYQTDPMRADTDGDGVNDHDEIYNTSTDPIVHDN